MTTAHDKFYPATITARTDHAPDLWSVRLRVEGESSLRFSPGQYATLGVEKQGKLVERAYSIVSSPYEPELEFFFELVPDGQLTPLLHKLQPGDTLSMRKAFKGRFTLDTQSGRTRHLLLATVTGVAPFISYVRTLYRDWKDGRFPQGHHLYLVEGASRSWEFGYHHELKTVATEVPWLTYLPSVSRPWEDPAWKGETGRVDDLIRKCAGEWQLTAANTTGYLCGHPDMIEHGKGILRRAGFPKENLKEEIYWIPAKPAKTG